MPHPWQPARLRRANRVQEDRTHHGRSQAFTAPATSHPPIESIRRTQTEPPHPGQLRQNLKCCEISLAVENTPCRVSSREQHLDTQAAGLQAAGCAKFFGEKASGARGDRVELVRVLKRLRPGDVLVVTRLDRLARSTRDL